MAEKIIFQKEKNRQSSPAALHSIQFKKRRSDLILRTPKWSDLDEIREFYKNCPDGYEVDHIIPVSKGGKHHEDNLQYLTAEENRKKGNKILVDGAGYDPTSGPL